MVAVVLVTHEVLHIIEDHPFLIPSILATSWATQNEVRLRRVRRACRQLAGRTTSGMSARTLRVRPADPDLRRSEVDLL